MRRYRNNHKKNFKILLALLITLSFGLGYAVLTQRLLIDGNVSYGSIKWDVGFKTAIDGGGTIASTSTISEDKKIVTIACNVGLSTASETCIVNATIENNSSFDVQLMQEPKVSYNGTYINNVETIWIDNSLPVTELDIINKDVTRELKLVITTKELTVLTAPTEELSVPITLELYWTEKDKADRNRIIVSNEEYINGTYYYDGTLKLGDPYSKVKTTEKFIDPQKIIVVIHDTVNDITTQNYRIVYSAYDASGKILNPGDTTQAMYYLTYGEQVLDLPNLYPTASKFRVDVMRFDGKNFYDIPNTATITIRTMQ